MTDGRDAKVTAAYRELGAEEPPQALDQAILAAARRPRAANSRSWTQRHAVPIGLAAVLVLSVTVTLRMQHEQPGIELPTVAQKQSAPVAEAPLRLKAEEQIQSAAEAQARPRAASRKEQAEAKPFADQARTAPAAPAAPAVPAPASADMAASRADASRGMESSMTGEIARQREERTSRDAEAAARAHQVGPLQALAKRNEPAAEAKAAVAGAAVAVQPAPAPKPAPAAERVADPAPEQELERIAALRRDGRHEDADKALAEFRKRYPDYRISDAMRERVERR